MTVLLKHRRYSKLLWSDVSVKVQWHTFTCLLIPMTENSVWLLKNIGDSIVHWDLYISIQFAYIMFTYH